MRTSARIFIGSTASAMALAAFLVLPASGTSQPGITSTQVSVADIVTQSGVAAADFAPYESGVLAYFHYVNKVLHGVYGRQLAVSLSEDDKSDPTQDKTLADNIIASNNAFALVGVATGFFGGAAHDLKVAGIPTFGYGTDNSWTGPKNFFADYGSVIDYATSTPEFAYVAKQVHATKIGIFALNYPSSKYECQPSVDTMKSLYGFNVVYSNLSEPIFSAPSFGPEVTNMINKGVNMIISCMDINSNVALSKAMQNGGMTAVPQVWVDGYDRSRLMHDASYMKNVYILIQHVPFESNAAFPGQFPGLQLYFNQMNASGFASQQYDDVALMGWESANLFVEGLRAAGANPTRATVIAAINRITNDLGGPKGDGVAVGTNWTVAHTMATSPSCDAFVKTSTGVNPTFSIAFGRGKDPWICFPLTGKANLNSPLPPPRGTPGV